MFKMSMSLSPYEVECLEVFAFKGKKRTYLVNLLRKLHFFLEGNTGQIDKFNRLETLREFLRLYEDGLTWLEIRQHLESGCHCQEVTGKRAKDLLEGAK